MKTCPSCGAEYPAHERLCPRDGAQLVDPPAPPPGRPGDVFGFVGRTFEGKYRVDAVVGEGGFGVVYRGHHVAFDRPIAIKCLKVPAHFTEAARQQFLQGFRREGKHLARLGEHPSVVRVYDLGTVDAGTPVPYLVLEWLEGEDLEHLLRDRSRRAAPFGEKEALDFLRPAIDALALAHGLGIAHRDVKPANLFVAETARGRALKILDFGIAKAMQEGESATAAATKSSSGFSAFSPRYGAPEQFLAKVYGATGPWTDVHALGLVLTEMVAGRPALEGDEIIELYEHCTSAARPTPRALGRTVSDAFEALCQKALARSPKDRFRDAAELLAFVDAIELDGPVGTAPVATIVATVPLEPAAHAVVTVPLEAAALGPPVARRRTRRRRAAPPEGSRDAPAAKRGPDRAPDDVRGAEPAAEAPPRTLLVAKLAPWLAFLVGLAVVALVVHVVSSRGGAPAASATTATPHDAGPATQAPPPPSADPSSTAPASPSARASLAAPPRPPPRHTGHWVALPATGVSGYAVEYDCAKPEACPQRYDATPTGTCKPGSEYTKKSQYHGGCWNAACDRCRCVKGWDVFRCE